MARNALKVLSRVRDMAVAQARRDLATSLADEASRSGRLDAHRALMAAEAEAATPETLAAFVRWLPVAQAQTPRLQAALAEAHASTEKSQAALVLRRTEAKAVAKALARQSEREAQVRQRQAQAALDEVASSRTGMTSMPHSLTKY